MNAISTWQPWATWIAMGLKPIETRGHDRFRGLLGQRIAIQAAKHWDERAYETAWPYLTAAQRSLVRTLTYPQGVIVCTAFVSAVGWLNAIDSRRALCPCGLGRFGLRFGAVQRCEPPVRARGHQGIWEIDDAAIEAADKELEHAEQD